MPGIGPRAEPGAEPGRSADIDAAATVGTWASAQAYQLGADQATTSPQRGYELGHDVGYSADLEHRGFVHGVMRGFEAGCAARHELVEQQHERDREVNAAAARARLAERQSELDAEAG